MQLDIFQLSLCQVEQSLLRQPFLAHAVIQLPLCHWLYPCEGALLAHVQLVFHWDPQSLQSCFLASSQPNLAQGLALSQVQALGFSLLNFTKFMLLQLASPESSQI